MSLLRFTLLLCLAGLYACGGTGHPPDGEPDGHAADAAALAFRSVHWDCSEDGPSCRVELNPDYAACAEGTWQSPVGLETPGTDEQSVAHLTFKSAPGGSRAYRYTGSLTTPPCTEDAVWLIAARQIELSAEQLEDVATP
jgi:carbonic anhydrase